MAGSFRNRKLFVAYSGAFKRQSAFGTPLATADINTRHPQSTPTYPGRTVTREQIRDCSGEYLIREDLTSRLSRLRFSFDADAFLIAGWLAYAQGAAAAPSGTQANEVQTITPTGTISGGTYNVAMTFEGITDNVDIPWNATAAETKTYLESLRPIKAGNVGVTGTLATTVVITFQGKLASYNMPALTIDGALLTGGGTIALSTTTPGTSKVHEITRTTNSQTPVTSIIVGFEGDTGNFEKFKDYVVNSVTIRGALRGKVTVELDLIGSADVLTAIGYSVPACVNINPIYTKDCRLEVNSTFISSSMREFTYTYSNNIFSGDDAFPYDDIDVERLEHGDRTSSFTFSVYGSKGDTIYTLGEAESVVPVNLYLGSPSNRVIIDAPKTSIKLADDPIAFAGEANRSTINITGTPFYDSGTSGTPDRVHYYGNETATFLAT